MVRATRQGWVVDRLVSTQGFQPSLHPDSVRCCFLVSGQIRCRPTWPGCRGIRLLQRLQLASSRQVTYLASISNHQPIIYCLTCTPVSSSNYNRITAIPAQVRYIRLIHSSINVFEELFNKNITCCVFLTFKCLKKYSFKHLYICRAIIKLITLKSKKFQELFG